MIFSLQVNTEHYDQIRGLLNRGVLICGLSKQCIKFYLLLESLINIMIKPLAQGFCDASDCSPGIRSE